MAPPAHVRTLRPPALSRQSAARHELLLQVDAGSEMDRGHAERLGCAHVGGRVIDKEEFAWPPPGALEKDFIDARVRLCEADMTRNDAVVEFVQEIVLALGKREGLVSEIAERVDRLAGRAQPAQQRDVFLDRFAKRLNPALVENVDFLSEFRKAFGSRGDRSREVFGDVRVRNEVHPKRSREEALHALLVIENLAVEIASIPPQQDVADVKDDDHVGFLAGLWSGRAAVIGARTR